MENNKNPFELIHEHLALIKADISANTEALEKLSTQSSSPPIEDIGGIEIAVKITGFSKSAIYAMTCKKEIPHSKKGKKLFFSASELRNWIRNDVTPK